MNMTTQARLDAAQTSRWSQVAKMEDCMHRMQVAERNGGAPDPQDAEAFETARQAVLVADVALRELGEQARGSLGTDSGIDVAAASRMDGANLHDAPMASGYSQQPAHAGRVDSSPLFRALRASGNSTTGKVVCRALLQGVVAGNLGRTTINGSVVPVGLYGAVPLVLAVQAIPVLGGIYFWNRVEPVSPPATGAKQATEGAAKANVALKSTPVSSVLQTYAAYEKVSVQSLEDQTGLAQAVEALLTGAVLRAADADAWTAFLAGSTAITPDVDGVGTIVRTAAKIAAAGGGAIRALVSPEDFADMVLTKASTSGTWLGVPAGVSLPEIVQSSGVPPGKLLVSAASDGAFVAVRQTIEALIGLDADDLTKNLRTILVEGRMVPGVRSAQLSFAGDLTT